MDFLAILVIIVLVLAVEHLVYCKKIFSNLEYKCYFSVDEAFEGDEIELIEEISNAKLLPVSWLKSELATSKWLEAGELESVVTGETRFISSIFMLKSYHKIRRSWKVKCLKRGVFTIDKTILVSSDLFGTMNTSMPVQLNARVRVLPAPLPADSISRNSVSYICGNVFTKRQIISDPFFYNGIHEYIDGDNLRRICWKATAPADELMIYNNDYTLNKSCAVILNCQSSEVDFGDPVDVMALEICIKVAASLLKFCADSGVPMTLLSNGQISENSGNIISDTATGGEQLLSCLRLLAELRFDAAESFGAFLNGTCKAATGTEIYVITPYIDEHTVSFAEFQKGVTILTTGEIPEYMPAHINAVSVGRNFFGLNIPEKEAECDEAS